MSYITDRKRVDGVGSSIGGVDHWISQRLTAMALIPLTMLFLFPFMRTLGADHATMLQTYAHPFNAIVAVMFFIVLSKHLQQGLQVVIEDYVHGPRILLASLLLNRMVWAGVAVIAVFAVAKIAFSA